MAMLAWDEKYAMGIAEIDQQHQRLLGMINDLHEALVAERGQEALGETVERMLAYAAYHFSTEEALLQAHEYPEFGAHRHEHGAFAAKAQELQRRVEAKRFVLTLEVLSFLREWLSNHILVNDKKYAPFLRSVGVR